jgi:hypothetical protein
MAQTEGQLIEVVEAGAAEAAVEAMLLHGAADELSADCAALQARGCALLAAVTAEPYGRVRGLTPDSIDVVTVALAHIADLAEAPGNAGSALLDSSCYDAAVDIASYGAQLLQWVPDRDAGTKEAWSDQVLLTYKPCLPSSSYSRLTPHSFSLLLLKLALDQVLPLLLHGLYHLYDEAEAQIALLRTLYNFCCGDSGNIAAAKELDVVEYIAAAQRNHEFDEMLQRYCDRLLQMLFAKSPDKLAQRLGHNEFSAETMAGLDKMKRRQQQQQQQQPGTGTGGGAAPARGDSLTSTVAAKMMKRRHSTVDDGGHQAAEAADAARKAIRDLESTLLLGQKGLRVQAPG